MPSDVERLVLQALVAEGALARQPFRRSAFILRRALQLGGKLTPELDRELTDTEALETDDGRPWPPELQSAHDALTRFVHGVDRTEPLVEGDGNFGWSRGNQDDPPAHPYYTACRLTEAGERVTRDLAGPGGVLPTVES
jgi:hypothetical protein